MDRNPNNAHSLRPSQILLAIAFCLGFAASATAQQVDLNTNLPLDPAITTGKLANGLTYFIRKNNYPEHRADFRLVIKAGSILEDNDQQGLAHFNEHMAFNGTKKYPGNALPSFLESKGVKFGAHVNAYTSFDETVYRFTLPTDQASAVDTGLDILSEWAHNVMFDPKEIDKERGVVGEEWRLGLGAGERIRNKEFPVILKGSRYAERLPIGLKPVIDTAQYDRVQSFYRDWYRPDLMAVIVVGDIDPKQIEQAIQKDFGGLMNPVNERQRPQFEIPEHAEEVIAVNTDKEETNATFNYNFIRPAHAVVTVADYRHDIIGTLYDEMLNARLQELQQSGKAPFAFAGAGDGQYIGNYKSYGIFGVLKPDSVLAGVTTLASELDRVRQHGFTNGELERAKKATLSAMENQYNERSKNKSDRYANEYVQYVLRQEPTPGIEYEYELSKKFVPEISLNEINSLTAERTNHASPVLSVHLPEPADGTPPIQAEAVLDRVHRAANASLTAYKEETVATSLMKSAPKAGRVVSEQSIAGIGVTEWTLSNGAKVILKPTDFKDDEILFSASAPGGTSLSSDADFLTAQFSSGLISASGVADFGPTQLQKMMMGRQVRLNPSVGTLEAGIQGSSSKKDLDALFQLVHLYASQPRMDSVTASSYLSRIETMLKNRDKDPQSAFMDTVAVTMSQYHPRSKPMTAERLKEIKMDQAYKFYLSRFANASNFTYYFVGSFDLKTMKPYVEQYLASLPAGNKEQYRDLGIVPPIGVIKKVVRKGLEPKSSVRLMFTGPFTYNRENRYYLSAMTEALAIKLREDLREDKSGVYGIGVSASPSKHPKSRYTMTISFGCDPKRVDELVGEVMKQIDTITSKPIEQIYVDKVKATNKRELETSMKENGYWMSVLTQSNWNGEDPAAILDRPKLIETLTPELVMQTAKQYFNRENYVQVTLIPEKL